MLKDTHCADCYAANGDDAPFVNLLRRRSVELKPVQHADIIFDRME